MPPAGQPRGCRVVRGVDAAFRIAAPLGVALVLVALVLVAFVPVAFVPVAFVPVAFVPVAFVPVAFVPVAFAPAALVAFAPAAFAPAALVAFAAFAEVPFAVLAFALLAFALLAFVDVDSVGAFDGARVADDGTAGRLVPVGGLAGRCGADVSGGMPMGALTAFFAIGFGVWGARRGGSVIGARVAACHTLEKSAPSPPPNRRFGAGVGGTV
jgi:hypothetical protein